MQNPIVPKHSAVASKAPTNADLVLGELAVNTRDGRLFLKMNNGTADVIVEFPNTANIKTVNGQSLIGSGNITISGGIDGTSDANFNNHNVTGVKILGFAGELDLGSMGDHSTRPPSDSVLVDFTAGAKQVFSLIGDVTVYVDTTSLQVGDYQLRIIQDSAGGHAATFAAPVSAGRWLGSAVEPGINMAANGETIVTFYWDGANFVQQLVRVGAA